MNLQIQKHKLTVDYYDEKSDMYIMKFSNEFHRAVRIVFFNTTGHLVDFKDLVPGKIYFMGAHINGKYYYFYRGYSHHKYFAKVVPPEKMNDYNGRVFLFLPISKRPYTESSNLNGMFHVSGEDINLSVLADFGRHTTDVISIVPQVEDS